MLKCASNSFEFGPRCGLRVSAKGPIQYLYYTWWFLKLLLGSDFLFARIVAPVIVFAPLAARVPWVVGVRTVAFASSMPFPPVLL